MKILKTIFGGGAEKLVESVGGVLDNLSTSKEEKLEAKRKIKELMVNHQVEVEKNVTARWQADLQNGNWLTRSVRPLVLIFLIFCTVLLVFIDSGSITFQVDEKWKSVLEICLITTIGAYFGGRSVEKLKK
tara:strand:- start:4 stop:396 length:393 start_codon:yes stop_codon:yes gene_type:complete